MRVQFDTRKRHKRALAVSGLGAWMQPNVVILSAHIVRGARANVETVAEHVLVFFPYQATCWGGCRDGRG